jgi:hypothetical protein
MGEIEFSPVEEIHITSLITLINLDLLGKNRPHYPNPLKTHPR